MADALSDLLRRLDFSAEVIFRSEFCGEWGVDTSGSGQVAFHLIVAGDGWLHNEYGPRRLLEGDLVLFPHDDAHVLSGSANPPNPADINQTPKPRTAGPATRLICGFFKLDRRAAAPLLESLPPTLVAHIGEMANLNVAELTRLWIQEAASNELGSDIAVDRLAELVFIQMLRTESAAGRLKGVVAALSNSRIGPVLTSIHQNPGGAHQLRDMAAQANMSESAFTFRFRAAVGMRPGEYVRHWRMHTAAQRLRDTDDPIDVIGIELGYQSNAAFRKAFRAYFDEPPARYRRRRS
jgi:AraC-like DNA-binding protein